MKIESKRVGTVDIREEDILRFPSGLIGLANRRRFVILEFAQEVPLGWLQDVDDPEFGVPVADPGIFVRDYAIEATSGEIEELGLQSPDECAILIVTTIGAGGLIVTGNLRAPLLVNMKERVGRQVVLDREDLDLRCLVDPVSFAQAPTLGKMTAAERTPAEAATIS